VTLPTIILYKKNSSSPIIYPGTKDNVVKFGDFIKKHTGCYVRLDGNIEIFDNIAKRYCSVQQESEKEYIIEEAQKLLTSNTISDNDKPNAEYYIKVTFIYI
jgi:hypothetical protein